MDREYEEGRITVNGDLEIKRAGVFIRAICTRAGVFVSELCNNGSAVLHTCAHGCALFGEPQSMMHFIEHTGRPKCKATALPLCRGRSIFFKFEDQRVQVTDEEKTLAEGEVCGNCALGQSLEDGAVRCDNCFGTPPGIPQHRNPSSKCRNFQWKTAAVAMAHVAVIHHRHGENVCVAGTEQALRDQIYNYVHENWSTEMGATSDRPPVGKDKAISIYFDTADGEYVEQLPPMTIAGGALPMYEKLVPIYGATLLKLTDDELLDLKDRIIDKLAQAGDGNDSLPELPLEWQDAFCSEVTILLEDCIYDREQERERLNKEGEA